MQVSIGSNNGLSPIRRQAIIWTSAGLLSIGPLGTNFSEILTKILFVHANASENIVCEKAAILSRGKWVKPRRQRWWNSVPVRVLDSFSRLHASLEPKLIDWWVMTGLRSHLWYFHTILMHSAFTTRMVVSPCLKLPISKCHWGVTSYRNSIKLMMSTSCMS